MAKEQNKPAESAAETPLSTAAAKILKDRLQTLPDLIDRLLKKRGPSAEDVHKVRVASRRAGAAIRLFADLLSAPQVKWWKKRLRKLRKAAGPVRSVDVLLAKFESPDADVDGLRAKRRQLMTKLQHKVRRVADPDQLRRNADELVPTVRCDTNPIPTFSLWRSQPLAEALKVFLATEPATQDDLAALHSFRIAGKRLRYTLELLVDEATNADESLLELIREFQSRLGHIQDSRDACRHAAASLAEADTLAALDQAVESLATEQQQLTEQLRDFWAFWKKAGPQVARGQADPQAAKSSRRRTRRKASSRSKRTVRKLPR